MNAQISALLTKVVLMLFLAVLAGLLIFGIIRLVRLFQKLKGLNRPKIIIYYFLMILCLFVMIPSWIFNIGWYRLILTFLAFPFVHYVLFAIINGKSMLKLFSSKKLKYYIWISFSTYIISYLSFPDGGDYGPMYVFFGLINNNHVINIASVLCATSFIIHVIVSVLQIIEINKIKQIENSPSK